jgi:hypothetical protein
MPFSLPTPKDYVELIGKEKARAYLQSYIVKSKNGSNRVKSYSQIKMCMCVDV